MRFPISSLVLALVAADAAAQCERPPIPDGGLSITTHPIEVVTYTDGVRTRGELIAPSVSAPSCGWPLIVYVHSLGAVRVQQRDWQRELAGFGFAVWSYDVRGQGDARFLNGPEVGTTLYGGQERFDLAEQIAFVRQRYPLLASPTRVGVTGDSQGGIHAWFAAVESGRTLTLAGRGSIVFPTVSAVAAADFVTEPTDHRLRGDTLFATNFIELMLFDEADGEFRLDPALRDRVLARFLASDPQALAADFRAEPHRLVAPNLANVAVPTLFFHGWFDSICSAGPILRASRSWPQTTPLRLVFAAPGHGSPRNVYQVGVRTTLTRRWFERYLWEEDNGVADEARFVLANMPLDAPTYDDLQSLWSHEHTSEFTPSDVAFERLYTDDSGRLSSNEPAAGTPSQIEHRVVAGYDAQAWIADPQNRALSSVLQNIPLSEAAFESDPLPNDCELVGAARVSLSAVPDAARFSLVAVLSAREPGASAARMLAAWGAGVLDATPGIPLRVAFELSPIATTLPAGTVLRLSIRNHWLLEEPHVQGLATVPMFDDSTVLIEHGAAAAASFVELPLRDRPAVALVTPQQRVDRQAPGTIGFTIRGGTARAGAPYVLAASCSGHAPGIDLPGGVVPLRLDPSTLLFLELVTAVELVDFVGFLDAAGEARPTLDLSGLQSLIGVPSRLTFAAWVYASPTDITGSASNPVDVEIR